MGRNYPSMTLGHLLDETQPNHDYEQQQQQQQRSMLMMNGTTNLPQWPMPPMNFTSTPIVK